MDTVLCDELLQEIIERLPPSSSAAVSLVSKRWLAAIRFSITTLSLRIPYADSPPPLPTFSAFLSWFPNLSSLTVLSSPFDDDGESYPPSLLALALALPPAVSSDALFLAVSSSPCAGRLSYLKFAVDSPVSSTVLLSSSSSLSNLGSLCLSSLTPISLRWLAALPCLKSLSLQFRSKPAEDIETFDFDEGEDSDNCAVAMLPLENLLLSGISASHRAMTFLWRRCGNLRQLRLRSCEGTGDGPSCPWFSLCLPGLRELELRACRVICDRVLLLAADHCLSLTSLLLHDGGSSEALHHFLTQRVAGLRTLDLRLPLDLHNYHLSTIAATERSNFPPLSTLRLQSCCLVTGDGLRALARAAAGEAIEELALVNCDVVEREPGLLTFLGQSLRRLRRLDLSYNDTLVDKVLAAMLVSCNELVEIRLRGCGRLTDAAVLSLLKFCGSKLEFVDLSQCPGIGVLGIESIVFTSCALIHISVEKQKISEAAMNSVLSRAIKVG
ncbi:hypothetical protein HPP92_009671 [Vanilla planifolia]|uniref:F-box domain-containing protein n=1 Tax=Vanilla planifolia TaxID=51239 RepID=A0A835REC9_VANPL|nr:hypothetical protein HPP92_009671 [Vanilla planifolia]